MDALSEFVTAQQAEYAAAARHDPHPDPAVSRLIREAEARGRREALREAASNLPLRLNAEHDPAMEARHWLRERADREAGC